MIRQGKKKEKRKKRKEAGTGKERGRK